MVGDPTDHTFGGRLRQAREEAGLSQEALAEAIGVVRRTVASYEAGTKTPRLDRFAVIVEALDKPPEWFLRATPGAGPPSKLDKIRLEVRRLRREVRLLVRLHRTLTDRLDQALGRTDT